MKEKNVSIFLFFIFWNIYKNDFNIWFLMDLFILEYPDHDLTIMGECLPVASITRELMCQMS